MSASLAHIPRRSAGTQAGFGLVELMVALAIGAVLVYGAVRLLMDTSNSRRTSDAATRVQEVARYAMSVIEPDVRLTSFWGRTNRSDFITNSATPAETATAIDALVGDNCGTNWTTNVNAYVEARDGGYDLDCDGETPTDYSDVLILRHASAETTAPTDGVIQVQAGRMRGELFADGAVPAGYAAAPATQTHDLVVNAYYVGSLGDDASGQPQWVLRRKRLASTGGAPAIVDEEIVRGVQDLQVQLGFDISGDGAADVYVNPGEEPADGMAVAVRVFLLVVAEDRESGFVNNTVYTVGNHEHDAFGDARRRIVVMKTILLRNPQN
jgi:type IV pilus assembly protein PilW